MAGHTQQPSGRGNPGPAPSPSPGPGPGPGASERVALKKEIGLVSACTIIIGEQGPGWTGAWGCGAEDAQPLRTRGTPLRALLLVGGGGTGMRGVACPEHLAVSPLTQQPLGFLFRVPKCPAFLHLRRGPSAAGVLLRLFLHFELGKAITLI